MSHNSLTINVNLKDRSYPIYIGNNIYHSLPQYLQKFTMHKQVVIVSTPPVSKLYLNKIKAVFPPEWQVIHYDVPDGEQSKCLEVSDRLYSWLIEHHVERETTMLPLGGGVVGDLAGFVAATFLRGINLVHVPTSLVAQVDSSIGGKVGINHILGKNLIGSFYQPKLVLIDTSVLQTLPHEELICGLGEIVKYGIIRDAELFSILEENLATILTKDPQILADLVQRCAKIKADIVSLDEKEMGIRAILNLGHTFGHALETYYGHKNLKHGQAVMLGIRCAAYFSHKQGLLSHEIQQRIENLISHIGIVLPDKDRPINTRELLVIMKKDKKIQQSKINLVLIKGIADVIKIPTDHESLIMEAFSNLYATEKGKG